MERETTNHETYMTMFREFVWPAKVAVILMWTASLFFALCGLASLFDKTLFGIAFHPSIWLFGAVWFFAFAHFQYFRKPHIWIPRYWE